MADAPGISATQRGERERDDAQQEPDRLVKMRAQFKFEGVARFIPNAVGVGGKNAEGVAARFEVGVKGQPPPFGFHPILVVTRQLIAIPDLLRRDVT